VRVEIAIRDFLNRIEAVQIAGTHVKRSHRVGDQGIESPMHMTTGIVISRNATSRWAQGKSGDHQGYSGGKLSRHTEITDRASGKHKSRNS
jgi:hypothetical protein